MTPMLQDLCIFCTKHSHINYHIDLSSFYLNESIITTDPMSLQMWAFVDWWR